MDRRIYRLIPAAAPHDSYWDRAENRGEVVVRADSAADARIVASDAEFSLTDVGGKPNHGDDVRFASAFRDDKLYAVVEDDRSGFPPAGPRAVLRGAGLRTDPSFTERRRGATGIFHGGSR